MRSHTRKKLVELHHHRSVPPAITIPSNVAMMRMFINGDEVDAQLVSIEFEGKEILLKPRCCGTDVDAQGRRT